LYTPILLFFHRFTYCPLPARAARLYCASKYNGLLLYAHWASWRTDYGCA